MISHNREKINNRFFAYCSTIGRILLERMEFLGYERLNIIIGCEYYEFVGEVEDALPYKLVIIFYYKMRKMLVL